MNELPLKKLEQVEREYFEIILFHLKENIDDVVEKLNSRLGIIEDWYEEFIRTKKEGEKPSDLDIGAERIFHYIYDRVMRNPNSSPIGADLLYETFNAFIHIDIKTALIDNTPDYKGKVPVGFNQTSYKPASYDFIPNLHTYYSKKYVDEYGNEYNKPCLTYIIQVIHEHASPTIYAILLISVPNGDLYSIYEDEIIAAGKLRKIAGKPRRDFRYFYKKCPVYKIISTEEEKKYRVEFVLLNSEKTQKELTGIKESKYLLPVHIK